MRDSSTHADARSLLWSKLRRTAFSVMFLSVTAFLSACGGCGPDEPEEDKCDGVTCERGVCSPQSGVCINADDCAGDDTKCLEGFECGDDNACFTDYPCNETDVECERGVCQAGACINAEMCSSDADCLDGFLCGDDGVCEEDPCESKTCERGVCQRGTGECVNKEVCAEASEDVDCLDGFKCYAQECVDAQGFCDAIDCQRGECSFEDKACVNAEDCAGEDDNCLDGFFCNDENACQENKCDTNMVSCDRGICDEATGDCVNPETCSSSESCLPMHLCVDNACVQEDLACGEEGCPGNQVCFYDEPQLEASCIENVDDGCTNAIDCVGDRVCVDNACAAPGSCEPDAFEPNDDAMSATDYFTAQVAGTLRAGICSGDVDTFLYDTDQDSDGLGKLIVELDYEPFDIGLGTLKVELINEGGMTVAEALAEDGRASLSFDVTIINKGVYTVRVSDNGDVLTAGIRYRLYVDVVDTTSITACEMVETLAADTPQMGNTISGNSAALTSTCADRDGVASEDIYAIEIAAPSYITATVTPDMSADVSVSLRSDCLRNASEVSGACAQGGGAGEVEEINALVDPGTYYIVVQGLDENTGGSYSLTWTRQDVVCTSADNGCVDANTAQTCLPDGTGFETEVCQQGCNMTLGECNRLDADLCSTATTVDPVTGLTGTITWDDYRDDYNPGQGGCVPADGDGTLPVDGPDITYTIDVPASSAVTVDLTANGNDVSLYLVPDCFDVPTSCQVGVNAGADADERLFWSNTTGAAQTVFVIADAAQAMSYTDSSIDISVDAIICTPGTPQCTTDMNGDPASEICNQFGTGYDDPETCLYGCDAMAGTCADPANDTCTGATMLTSGVPATGRIEDYTNTDPLSSSDCLGFSSDGPDAIYAIAANAGDIVEVTMEPSGFDAALWASAACDTMTDEVGACITGADEGFTSGDETIIFRADQAGTYYIVANSYSTTGSGTFTITATTSPSECTPGQPQVCQMGSTSTIEYCDDLGRLQTYTCSTTCTNGFCDDPTGDVCVDPIRLTGTSGSEAGSYGGSNAIEVPAGISGGCYVANFDESDGRENIYAIDLAAGDVLSATLSTTETDAHMFILSDCLDLNSCEKNLVPQGPGSLSFLAPQAGTYFIVVDSSFSTSTDSYTLDWEVLTGLSCAPGEPYCQTPTTAAVCNDAGTGDAFTVSCSQGCQSGYCLPDVATSDTCAAASAAPDIGTGVIVFHNYDALTDDVNLATPNCAGSTSPGGDAFYKVTVQPNEILRANVQALDTFDDPVVYIFEDCMDPAGTCLEGGTTLGSAPTTEVFWANDTGVAKTVLVGADSDSSFSDEPFILTIDKRAPECTPGTQTCEPNTTGGSNDTLKYCNEYGLYETYVCDGACGTTVPGQCDSPTGEVCLDAIPLTGTSGSLTAQDFLTGDDLVLGSGQTGGCFIDDFDENDGPDTFYRVDLLAGQVLTANLNTAETTAYLFLYEDCSPSSCVANNPGQGSGTVSYYAEQATTVYLVVDSDSTTSLEPYDLSWNISSGQACVPGGFRCVDANTLGICSGDGLTEAQVTCSTGCANGACNPDLANGDTCATASAAPDIGGGIAVYATYDGLTNDIDMATPNCTNNQTDGNDLFYKVTVQPNEILNAKAVSYGDEPPLIYAIEDCADPVNTCIAGAEEAGSSNTAEFFWVNDTGMAKTLIVAADNEFGTADEPFGLFIETRAPECTPGTQQCVVGTSTLQFCNDLGLYETYTCSTTCGQVTPDQCDNPDGNSCFEPERLTGASGTVSGDFNVSGTNAFEPGEGQTGGCFIDSFDEPDATDDFYIVSLAAGDVLEVTLATPETSAFVFILENCDPSSCVANNPSQGPTTLSYYAAQARDVIVVVDSSDSFGTDTYDLSWNIKSGLSCAPGGFRCVDATTLGICSSDGTTEAQVVCANGCADGACGADTMTGDTCAATSMAADVGQGIAVYSTYDVLTNDIDMPTPNCTNNQTDGPDLFYKVTVQPNEILTAWVDSYGDEPPLIYAFEDCADPSNTCIAGAEEAGSSNRAEIFWANDTGMAKTLIVAADNEFGTADEPFGLFIQKQAPVCTPGVQDCAPDGSTLRLCNEFGLYDLYSCDGGCGNINAGQCDNPSGDVCFDALTLSGPSGSLTDQPFDGGNLYELGSGQTGGCFVDDFDENDGPDTFYRVDLAAGDVLDVTLSTAHSEAYLFLLESCSAADECVKNNPTQGPTSLSYYADQARTIYVVVDTDVSSTMETYDLSWNIRTGLVCAPSSFRCVDANTLGVCAGDGLTEAQVACATGCANGACNPDVPNTDTCAVASAGMDIGQGIAVYATYDGLTDDIDEATPNCTGEQTDGPDMFYKVTVNAGDVLHAWVDSYGDEPPLVYAFEDCADVTNTCVAGASEFASSNRAEIFWANDTGMAKTLIVAADNEFGTADEPFGLFIEALAPQCVAGTVTCAAGQLELCNQFGLYDYYACDGGCNATNDGCLNPQGDVCADAVTLTGATGTFTGDFAGTNQVIFGEGQTGGCFVDSFDESDDNDTFFKVDLQANDVLRVNLSTANGSAHLFLSQTCGDPQDCIKNDTNQGSGTLTYYATQAETLYVTVDSSGSSGESFDLTWEVITGLACAPNQFRCVDAMNLGKCSPDGLTETTTPCNCADGACTDEVAVNDTCQAAARETPVAGAFAMYGTYDDHTNDIDMATPNCANNQTDGPEAIIPVTVQPGEILHAWVDSYGDESPLVYAISDCADPTGTCVAGGEEDGASNRAELYYTNTSMMAETLLVAVDSEFGTADEPFGLFFETLQPQCMAGQVQCAADGVTLEICNQFGIYDYYTCNGACDAMTNSCANPTGDICLDTIKVNPGGTTMVPQTFTYTGVAFSGLTNSQTLDNAMGCTSFDSANGPDQIYQVELAAGQTIDVDQTSLNEDSVVYILTDCGDGGASCVAGADDTFTGGTETVTYTNNTGAAQTVFVVADAYFSSATDTFDVTITVR